MWYPINHGKPWTIGEMKTLKAMLNNDATWPYMCEILGRSITAVYERAKLLRFADFAKNLYLADSVTIKDYGHQIERPEELRKKK
jgi:hypothetical protein